MAGIGSPRILWNAYGWLYRAGRAMINRTGLMESPVRGMASTIERAVRRLLFSRAAYTPNPVVVDGHIIFHSSRDFWSTPESIAGTYEPEVCSLIRSLLTPGMTFVDVGANIGFFTLLGARCVGPTGRVYAFEPETLSHSLLVQNVQANGYANEVIAVKAAVSRQTGEAEFYLGVEDRGTSSVHKRPGVDVPIGKVAMVSLDGFFGERGWPPVDLVKVDVEGHEKRALEGMVQLSARNPRLRLIVEFCILPMAAAGVQPEELIATVRGLGLDRISLIGEQMRPVRTSADVLTLMRRARYEPLNLLCERAV